MTTAHLLLGLFILGAYTAEAVTGFGSIVIALSLGALFFPIDWLQVVLVPLNVFMSGFLSWKYRHQIHRPILLKLILPFMLFGTFAGYLLQPHITGQWLKLAFALLILWFSLRELYKLRHNVNVASKPGWWSRSVISAAGVTHGLFASGGPLLVYGLTGVTLDKARFRATLIFVWFTLNLTLTLLFLSQGQIQQNWQPLLAYLPLLPIGVWLGERLHHRVDESAFRVWIFRILTLSAAALLLSGVMAIWRASSFS